MVRRLEQGKGGFSSAQAPSMVSQLAHLQPRYFRKAPFVMRGNSATSEVDPKI